MTQWYPAPSLRRGTPAESNKPRRLRAEVEQHPDATDRWTAAENRLYPLVMVDPDLYEAAVELVCQALNVLRSECGTVAELRIVDPDVVLHRCPGASTLAGLGLDPRVAFDAACARRLRDLTAERPPVRR